MKIYGYLPDAKDIRDLFFGVTHNKSTPLPLSVSLRGRCPPVFDQGALGSCTANASAAAFAYEHGGGPYSRLQIYYNERVLNNTVLSDSGAQIRDSIKVLATDGVALESEWPYDVARFTQAPPKKCVAEGLSDRIITYSRLQHSADYKQCLADGYPFIFGFTVFESFESQEVAQTGIVPMPKASEQCLGGHAVMAIGYKMMNGTLYYEVRNSWGTWGDQGNFWIPAAYAENSQIGIQDCWTIRK